MLWIDPLGGPWRVEGAQPLADTGIVTVLGKDSLKVFASHRRLAFGPIGLGALHKGSVPDGGIS